MEQADQGKRKPRKLAREELWEYACKALGRAGIPEAELRRKLERRGSPEDVENVLLRLKAASFLDDSRFAATYAASRLEGQKWGKQRVAEELLRRDVNAEQVREAVEELYQEVDESALAEAFLLKRYAKLEDGWRFTEPQDLVSAFRKLRRAGFAGATAARALRQYSALDEIVDALAESAEEME